MINDSAFYLFSCLKNVGERLRSPGPVRGHFCSTPCVQKTNVPTVKMKRLMKVLPSRLSKSIAVVFPSLTVIAAAAAAAAAAVVNRRPVHIVWLRVVRLSSRLSLMIHRGSWVA